MMKSLIFSLALSFVSGPAFADEFRNLPSYTYTTDLSVTLDGYRAAWGGKLSDEEISYAEAKLVEECKTQVKKHQIAFKDKMSSTYGFKPIVISATCVESPRVMNSILEDKKTVYNAEIVFKFLTK